MNDEEPPPAEQKHGDRNNGSGPAATGITALVGFAQTLEEPWRGLLSVAGPAALFLIQRLGRRMIPLFNLLEVELLWMVLRLIERDPSKRDALKQKVDAARMRVVEEVTTRIRRGR